METVLKWYKAEEKIPNKGDSIIFCSIGGKYMIGTVDSTTPYHKFLFSVKIDDVSCYVDKSVFWAYFTPPKEKEFHVYLDSYLGGFYTYCGTLEALNSEQPFIQTTQLSFLSTALLEKYRVFLHKGDKQIEITLGECQGTDRIIKAGDNLEKLVLGGEFSFADIT